MKFLSSEGKEGQPTKQRRLSLLKERKGHGKENTWLSREGINFNELLYLLLESRRAERCIFVEIK